MLLPTDGRGGQEIKKENATGFDQWMTDCDFEDHFWAKENAIYDRDGWIGVQHPRKPDTKHDNEHLPLLILAKHENGQRKNWDMRLQIRATEKDEFVGGFAFDAEYQFSSLQPTISDGENRAGRIEFVRGMTPQQCLDFRAQNETMQREGIAAGAVQDIDHGIPEMKAAILTAVRIKAGKNYSPDTALVVWLRDEKNPHFAGYTYADPGFPGQICDVAGGFTKLCIVGVLSGCHWAKGIGL